LPKSRFFSSVEIIGTRGNGAGQFNKPRALAVDHADNLYVVDMTGRVQKFSPRGDFLLSWQMPQTDLGKPKGMCLDHEGNVVVLEPHYSRVNHFDGRGRLLAQWGVHGTNAGQLAFPRSVAVNSKNDIYTSEYGLTERIQKFSARGAALIFSLGEAGNAPGQFNRPEGITIGPHDELYVADSCNHRVQVFDAFGKLLSVHGKAGSGPGELSYPYDIRVDAEGRQYVCEFGNSRIQIFNANGNSLEIIGGAGAGPGEFSNPWSIAFDSRGNLYVADSMNHRVQKLVRREPSRMVTVASARRDVIAEGGK
jgi:DNA-binding beta-propeller fold protein YncE